MIRNNSISYLVILVPDFLSFDPLMIPAEIIKLVIIIISIATLLQNLHQLYDIQNFVYNALHYIPFDG